MFIFAPEFDDPMTTQKPISKSPISDAFLSKNADGNYLSNDCFCARCKNITGFTFTGKELDAETGFSYFGARYLDHTLTTAWLSVDPMSDKYPSISPYAYCAWNPVKLVDPEGTETMENNDGWKVDKQNKTISRVSLSGGDLTQFVEGDGEYIRHESRCDLYNEYKGFTVIDNLKGGVQIDPAEEKEKANAVSPVAIMGTLAGSGDVACSRMKNYIFDYENGTYMGKDGSIKIMKKGKNGGLNGRYKSQIELSNKYGKAATGLKWLGRGFAAWSAINTEIQAHNGLISNGERITDHAINLISLFPYCWHATFFYELGKKYGPSTWF